MQIRMKRNLAQNKENSSRISKRQSSVTVKPGPTVNGRENESANIMEIILKHFCLCFLSPTSIWQCMHAICGQD